MVSHGVGKSERSPQDFLSEGGELGALLRAKDWSGTTLGPIERWPQSLRASVSTCLNSRFAIVVCWGPELVMLYNDAYREIIASKHPDALGRPGRECWPEIWDTIGPMLEGVLKHGVATWSNDLLLLLERRGYPEECYFTFSYSPIRDESGGVGGVFTPVIETTDRVVAERRSHTLRELAACIVEAKSEANTWALAAEIFSKSGYDISFSVLYAITSDRKHIDPKSCEGLDPNHALSKGVKEIGKCDPPLLHAIFDALTTGEMCLVSDLHRQCSGLPLGVWGIPPTEAVAVPVVLPGYPKAEGSILFGLNPRKRFDEEYRLFLDDLARQFGSNLAAARAYDEETKRAKMLAELDRAKTVFFSNVSREFRTPLSLMQAAGGLDYLIIIAARALRIWPAGITLIAPLIAYLFTFAAGTGHIIYALLPVIAEVSRNAGIRPERPLSIATIASQQAITASPISAATVALLGLLAPAGVQLQSILLICVPSTLLGSLLGAVAVMWKGPELKDDPIYKDRLARGLIEAPASRATSNSASPMRARGSVIVFLLAVMLVVGLGLFPSLRPTYSLSTGEHAPIC